MTDMTPRYLARLALARLIKPYDKEVIFHVFCEIERTPHLRKAYDELLETYDQGGLNKQIGIAVSSTLKATATGRKDVRDVCEIVSSPSVLEGIKSNWKWEWEYDE